MDIENIYRLASKGADLLARGDDFAESEAVHDLVKAHRELVAADRWDADQIADACIAAEIPDSKYESLMIALGDIAAQQEKK